MIRPEYFFKLLSDNGISFFTGIPDSLLKDFCLFLLDNVSSSMHIIPANEGAAVSLACGYHLSKNKIPLVYMQNSGIGNALNPLLSLADKKVFSIPMMLLVGWRGEPCIKDEPQHKSQGEVTQPLLETSGIPHLVMENNEEKLILQIDAACRHLKNENSPFAFIVRKDIFSQYKSNKNHDNNFLLSREDAIGAVLDRLENNSIVISTTGMISRELYEHRERKNQSHSFDFLTVGSMGHASQIALTVALNSPEKSVYCFDGDGAALMHLGGLSTIGRYKPSNLTHIIFNNASHDSVGGQPTGADKIDFPSLAKSLGFINTAKAENIGDIASFFDKKISGENALSFFEIRVKKGSRPDLKRPSISPIENKLLFMKNFL